jgi:ribose transport system substrate-binding protein
LAVGGALVAAGAGCGSSNDGSSSTPAASTGSAAASTTASGGTDTTAAAAAPGGDISQLKIGELNFDPSKYCGSKPFKVGAIDGFGGNAWRVETRALVEKVAKACPNNQGVQYFDANLDPQKFNSTINSWAAQGVNIIVAFDDFGQGAVPAFRAAQQKGVKVVTDNAIPGNAKVPNDVTAAVVPDFDKGAKAWVEFLDKATKGNGKIVLIGGPAGNLFDGPAIDSIKKAIQETGSKVQLVEQGPQYANWDPAKTQQVMSSLLAKNKDINGVVLTYMATAPAVIRAFKAAGLPLPAIAGQSSSNEVVCQVKNLSKSGLQALGIDGSANQAALALAKGLAAYQGISAPELGPTDGPTVSNYATYIDTVNGKIPTCDPSLPAGADLSTALTLDEIKALLK